MILTFIAFFHIFDEVTIVEAGIFIDDCLFLVTFFGAWTFVHTKLPVINKQILLLSKNLKKQKTFILTFS